jgi:virulence-associated protein VapD
MLEEDNDDLVAKIIEDKFDEMSKKYEQIQKVLNEFRMELANEIIELEKQNELNRTRSIMRKQKILPT